MADVIQATCPNCKQVLRVPADWIGRSLRCKHCKQVFQAKGTPSAAPLAAAPAKETGQAWLKPVAPPPAPPSSRPTAPAPARPAPARKTSGDPFSFDDDAGGVVVGRRKQKSGGWWKGALIAVLAIAIAGGLGFFFRDDIALLFNPKATRIEPISQVNPEEKEPEKEKEKEKEKEEVKPRVIGAGEPKKADPDTENPKSPPIQKKKKEIVATPSDAAFPRRALLINVNSYLLANTVDYGSSRVAKGFSGASTGALKEALSLPPFKMPANQVFELSDGSKTPFATLKPVIESAITDFLNTCRQQDRVMILFAGHAVDHDMEAYLVPWEGDLKNKETLIPLSWVYEKLAGCKARQKVLVLDVCRLPTAHGFELPGGGAGAPNHEMTELLDTKLRNPPPGVQVWSACIKGQNSVEFGSGSLFLEAICTARQKLALGAIAEPTDPLPLEKLVPEVNQYMKSLLASQKMEQTSRLTGKEPEGGASYNAAEASPAAVAFKLPGAAGTKFAGKAVIKSILDEINLIPPAKASQLQGSKLDADRLPLFAVADIDPYKADYRTLKELQDMVKSKPEQYALRDAVLKAATAMKDTFRFSLEEHLSGSAGATGVSDAMKKQILKTQKQPAMAIFQLETMLNDFKTAGGKRDEETSKRWQAHYDYCHARLMSRIVFIYEHDFILAQVRSDSLPTLEKVHNGWRVGSRSKVQISEGKVKDMVKQINKTWEKVANDYPGTPWAMMARREQLTSLGLEWRPSRD